MYGGNTSAYAEKTNFTFGRFRCCWKHLRVRGENSTTNRQQIPMAETPPRTRRKLGKHYRIIDKIGNTSAYAEKTPFYYLVCAFIKKHLRVRGENVLRRAFPVAVIETPPRTRRKLGVILISTENVRNTSAYAEKTEKKQYNQNAFEKHLRVRGENHRGSCGEVTRLETPPRTRRKHSYLPYTLDKVRNTSAYAEKTGPRHALTQVRKKHLRVRGENISPIKKTYFRLETPPRTRRKHYGALKKHARRRNTSAYAEKTSWRTTERDGY